MKNINSIISSHNKALLHPQKKDYFCNCRDKALCPLENKCLTPRIVYQADVTNNGNDDKYSYIGASDTTFKERYRNHVRDFNNERYVNCTELSKYVWQLKRDEKDPIIKWKIVCQVHGNSKNNYCLLCLKEKFFIITYHQENSLLNKRSELISKCRHLNKNLLAKIKRSNDSMD